MQLRRVLTALTAVSAVAVVVACTSSSRSGSPGATAPGTSSSTSAGTGSTSSSAAAADVVHHYLPFPATTPVGSVQGRLFGPSGLSIPGTLDVLQVTGQGASTLVRLRLSTPSLTNVYGINQYSAGFKAQNDIAGLELDDPSANVSLRPDIIQYGNVAVCTCSTFPRDTASPGIELSALFPALPQSTSSVRLVLVGFPPVTVPVSRAEAQAGNDAVPVLGATPIAPLRSAKDPSATFLVHGVRRIPSGTVVYYSVGAAGGGSFSSYPLFSFTPSRARGGSDTWGPLFVVDPVHRKGYEGLVTGEKGTWIASDRRSIDSSSMKAGHQYVGYEVFPALPPDVTTVDLVVGHGEVLSGLPVQDGALSPTGGSATQPLELGSGWPQIDLNAVASSYQPQLSVHDLQTTVSTLDKSLTTTRKPGNVRVDLSADVLFAIDKADLTPAAQSRLRAAADTINAQAKQGVITIVGHTDNTGTGTHNDALSLARARAVAHALKPMITVQGVTFDVSGRGEREPVATNGTVEGRRQNRRVSIGFTPRTD